MKDDGGMLKEIKILFLVRNGGLAGCMLPHTYWLRRYQALSKNFNVFIYEGDTIPTHIS